MTDTEFQPTNLKSAIKAADERGWTCMANYAVGPDPEKIESWVFQAVRFHPTLQILNARWEAKPGQSFGFASGWRRPGVLGIPDRLGYRELMAVLKEAS